MDEATAVDVAAKTAHEVNRAYCAGLGDDSQLPWDEAPEWQRQSAVNGAAAILMNPDMGPEQQHESWFAEKAKDGWVHGETKDPEAKTHPCMVSYHALPKSQRAKDSLFGHTVRGVLAKLLSA